MSKGLSSDTIKTIEGLSIEDLKTFYCDAQIYFEKYNKLSKELDMNQQKLKIMDDTCKEIGNADQSKIILDKKVEVETENKRIWEEFDELDNEKIAALQGINKKHINAELIAFIEKELLPKKREYLNKTESKDKYFVRVANYLSKYQTVDVTRMDDSKYVNNIIFRAHTNKYIEVCKCPSNRKHAWYGKTTKETEYDWHFLSGWYKSGTRYEYSTYPSFNVEDDKYKSADVVVNNESGNYYCPNIADRNIFSIDSTKCLCKFKEKKLCTIL